MDKFNIKDSHPNISRLEKLFLEEGVLTKFKKNEYLVQQNEKTNQIGFIMSGMFRLSHIDADANEWIVGYSFVNDFVCDYPSFIKQATSTVNMHYGAENQPGGVAFYFSRSIYRLLPNVKFIFLA